MTVRRKNAYFDYGAQLGSSSSLAEDIDSLVDCFCSMSVEG